MFPYKVEYIYASPEKKKWYQSKNPVDAWTLAKELEALLVEDRILGYASTQSFFERGVSTVAAPVRDAAGRGARVRSMRRHRRGRRRRRRRIPREGGRRRIGLHRGEVSCARHRRPEVGCPVSARSTWVVLRLQRCCVPTQIATRPPSRPCHGILESLRRKKLN